MARRKIREEDYASLAELRYSIRRFLEFSEREAKHVGLTPRQHQALLAIRGFGGGRRLTVGELAERLLIRHHSAVELANRLVEADLVARVPDESDQRRVLLALTERAGSILETLSAVHLDELSRIRPELLRLLQRGAEPA